MKARPSRFEPVALATNDSEKEVSLSELDLLGDSLQARVRVRSHGFAAEKAFMIDDISLVVDSLHAMSSKREGEVRLGAAYEDDEVVLAMNDRGQLFVRGRLVTYGEGTHRLEFQFRTDQTALKPFVQALGSLLAWAK
jgi:hypothetical protein